MKILVVKLADIGDVLLTTPALRALRESFPAAQITALVTPGSRVVLANSALVDEVWSFDKTASDSPLGAARLGPLADALRLRGRLQAGRFDRVVVFHHLSTTWGARKFALLARAAAPRRLGLDNGRGGFLTERLPDQGFGARHEVEYWLDLVKLWGATTAADTLDLSLTPADEAAAERLLPPGDGAPLVALHAGAGAYSQARRWPWPRFAEVGRLLRERLEARLVVLGGPHEVALSARLTAALGGDNTINLAGRTSLGELAAVLKRCALYVGNDSGVTHIAAAMRTPTVAVFGPSNHRAWGPWPGHRRPDGSAVSTSVAVVRVALPCSPCLYVGTGVGLREGCPARTCLQLVTPERMAEIAERVFRTAVRI